MKGRSLARACSVAAILLGALRLFAENDGIRLEDSRKTVRIGFSRLRESNLSLNQKTMADTIPMRLRDSLSSIDTRVIAHEEAEAYRSASLMAKIMGIGLKLDEGIKKYDLKILTEKGASEAKKARKNIIGEVNASRQDLKAYSLLEPSAVRVADSKAIDWIRPNAGSPLFPHPLSGPQALCIAQDLDIVISGEISGSNDYAFLEIYAYHRFLGKRIFEWKTAFAEDDSPAALAEFSASLAKALLGRETTALRISAVPENAEIRVDGAFVGNSPYVSPYALPGKHEIEVSCPGFRHFAATVTLEEGESIEKSFTLESLNLGNLGVNSQPEGASVYLGATKVGNAPVDVPVLEQPRSGRVMADGYMDKVFVIPEDAAKTIDIGLISEEEGEKKSFGKQRDRFYISAGALMVSLPVSVLCVGMFSQYYTNLSNIDAGNFTEEQKLSAARQMEGPFYGWQTAAYVSCGVSSGLLGYCIYRFALYLKSSQ